MQIKILNQFLINRTLNYNKKNNIQALNRKNIYIFPTFFGFQLGFFLFFCLLAATIYQNNFSLLIFITLFFIFFISILLTFQNLQNISFTIKPEVMVEQSKFENIHFIAENADNTKKLNIHFDIDDKKTNIDLHKGLNKIQISHKFFERGVFNFPTLNCYTIFPFGIIKAWSYQKLHCKVFVYPAAKMPPRSIHYYINTLNINQNDEYFDFSHLDEYRPGDSLSKVAWKISSAKKKKFTKKFESENLDEKILIDFDKIHPNDLYETRLQYCSYLIKYCYDKKKEFAFKIGNQTSDFGSNRAHLEKIQKKLCYAKDY